MRILYFSRDYTTHDHRFLSTLARTEHQIYYLRLERRGHQLEDRPLPPEVERIRWIGGQAPMSLRHGPGLLVNLKRIIRQYKPDLIQAGPLQRAAFLVALTGFRPLISMSWGYDLLQDAHRNKLWRLATRFTLKRSAAMVGDCETIRKLAILFGMPGERIVTFPWGIDLTHFSPTNEPTHQVVREAALKIDQPPSASSSQPFTLLSTRAWEPVYGVEVIARAFVQASKQRPDLCLVMLGNGSQAPLLHQIFRDSGIITNYINCQGPTGYHQVFFPGQIEYADLPRYYRSADLYVAATQSDGTSISLLEAMACGCPVLVSDIPGNREWVTHGENGWLFPEGNVPALAAAILHAIERRELLPEMGRASRQLAGQRADWDKNFRELLRSYEIAMRTMSPL